MTWAEIISVVALLVSIASLCSSFFFGLRDRARLVTGSRYLPLWEENPAHVCVSIVNAGRRPVILRMWVGAESTEKWEGHFLGEGTAGLRLGEHERYEFKLEQHDLHAVTPDEDFQIEDLWFEDTLGRQHTVRDVRANLAKLRAT